MWKEPNEKTICQNRKAWHEYTVLDTIEAGIVLKGTEIKSIRDHKISLDGSYAKVENGEVWLIGCNIDEYNHSSPSLNHEPKRKRKLLLHKREIDKFAEKAEQIGHTLVPLKVYLSKGKAKVELAVCKGRQLHDKRQALKDRDAIKEMRDG